MDAVNWAGTRARLYSFGHVRKPAGLRDANIRIAADFFGPVAVSLGLDLLANLVVVFFLRFLLERGLLALKVVLARHIIAEGQALCIGLLRQLVNRSGKNCPLVNLWCSCRAQSALLMPLPSR